MGEWARRMEDEGRMAGIREAQARVLVCRRERRGARDQEAGAGAGREAGEPLNRRKRGPAA